MEGSWWSKKRYACVFSIDSLILICSKKSLIATLVCRLQVSWVEHQSAVSMSSKRRRATSPSSSVSGGGDLDDASSTPGSGRKRRRTSNIPTVDPVHEPHIFSVPRHSFYVFRHLVYFILVVLIFWVANFIRFFHPDFCLQRAVQHHQGLQGWPRKAALWILPSGSEEKVHFYSICRRRTHTALNNRLFDLCLAYMGSFYFLKYIQL